MSASLNDNRGPEVVATAAATIVLSTIAVALRMWSRSLSKNARFWWDDWTALAAWPLVLVSSALEIYWVSLGLGQHMSQLTRNPSQTRLAAFIGEHFYNTSLTLIKISALLFYARVFKVVRWFRLTLWVVGAMVVSWWIAIEFVAIFACIPVQKTWELTIPGHCAGNNFAGFLGTAAPNVITDILILLLPLPMLWGLHVGLKHRLGLTFVFILGYSTVVLSILRMVKILELGKAAAEDVTWNLVTTAILLLLEPGLALISVCLPAIVHLLRHVYGAFLSTVRSGSQDSSSPIAGAGSTGISRVGNPVPDQPKLHSRGFAPLTEVDSGKPLSYEGLFNVRMATEDSPDTYHESETRYSSSSAEAV